MSEFASQMGTVSSEPGNRPLSHISWIDERLFRGMTFGAYLRSLVTPINAIIAAVVLSGFALIAMRFVYGLAAVTSASQEQPWGLMLSWGLFSGVPLSASGFVIAGAVYILGLKQYHPILKNAVLIGFIGYLFAVIFLLLDLGRPWRLPYPIFVSYGTASVLLEVAWCVALYLSVLFLEFSPSIFEWGGWKTLRKYALSLTIGLTIFGVILSTLHQSSLGAMFLLTPSKLHPLWYTPYLPALFFVSAIGTGIAMAIIASWLTGRFLKGATSSDYLASINKITLGLAKGASLVLFAYFGMKVVALAHGHQWNLLNTPYGYLYLAEVLGFVLLPCLLFVSASGRKSPGLAQIGAVMVVLGTVLNRFNVSLIAFNWQLPDREFVTGKELLIVIAVVTVQFLLYRWIVTRMPILHERPEYHAGQNKEA